MVHVNWRRQLMLAVALVVLASLTYWLEFGYRPKKEEQAQEAKKLCTLKDVRAQTISITSGGLKITFSCIDPDGKLCKAGDNSKWNIISPVSLKADDTNVNTLLSSITSLASSDSIDLNSESPEKKQKLLKEYLLDQEARSKKDSRKVEIVSAAGDKYVVTIGDVHPMGDTLFVISGAGKPEVKLDEGKVFLIPVAFKSNFEHDLSYWRDKKLFSISAMDIGSFELQGSKAKISGIRKDGQWTLRPLSGKQEDFTGDIEGVDNMMTSLTYLTAKGFISDNKNDAVAKKAMRGFKKTVTFTVSGDPTKTDSLKPITLTVWTKKDPKDKSPSGTKLYATMSNMDPLYELESYFSDKVDKSLNDLRLSKLITSVNRYTAKRLEFSGADLGKETFAIINADSQWKDEAGKAEVKGEKVQELLDKLSGNRIKDFLDGKKIPAGEASGLKAVLMDEKKNKMRELVFWKHMGKLYGRDLLSKRNEAFLIDEALIPSLPFNRDAFKEPAPAVAPSGIPGITGLAPHGGPGAPPLPPAPQKK
jgi:hypothetical protein